MWKPWVVLSILVCIVTLVSGHGRLIDPPARSSMWRFNYKTHKDFNDNGLFCGGHQRYYENNKRCGICGEAWNTERDYDGGGRYATGIIVRHYTVGQVINVTVDLTANHFGYYIFRICPHNNYRTPAKQECLNMHPLQLADSSSTKVKVERDMNRKDTFRLRLPANITCEQCVFQWSYYTALTDELFQNCADVSIRESPKRKTVTCKAIGKMVGMDHWCEWNCGSGHCKHDYERTNKTTLLWKTLMTITFKTIQNSELRVFRCYFKPKKTADENTKQNTKRKCEQKYIETTTKKCNGKKRKTE